ncbi:PadR family transcriptional regulator [Humidisolicoccus flavus]|uniref:PadR family transcriptional regulator n=1 Tax=Humidisolicoccus flavus TaxID=3111414 RepID=UPI003248C5D8
MMNSSESQVNSESWPPAWLRTVRPTAVLAVLSEGALHGYGIVLALDARGLGRPLGGSLYPLLGTLETEGAVEAVWNEGESGPGRRVYTLTPLGRQRLESERAAWHSIAAALGPEGPQEHGAEARRPDATPAEEGKL